MDKKAQINGLAFSIMFIFIAGVLLVFGIIMISGVNNAVDFNVLSNQENITADFNDAQTLEQIPTSNSATRKNRTWLEFDGLSDFAYFRSDGIQTVALWYNPDTSANGWSHVVNSSEITYVNGSLADLTAYPIHNNGTDFIIGKSDSSTFFEGAIDEIRAFNDTLNDSIVTEIFGDGR